MKTNLSKIMLFALAALILDGSRPHSAKAETVGAPASASASNLSLDVLGGVGFAFPSIKAGGTEPDKSSKVGFVGGIGANYFFSPEFSVELDALYARRAFNVKGVTETEFKLDTFQVPLIARYWILPDLFSVGVGGYWAVTSGDGTPGLNRADAGLVGSLQGRYPVAQNVHVLLDARFDYGLINQNVINDDNNSFKQRDLTVLAGVGYSF